ncbi:MAG: sulfatase-like hydrolase/transferase [Bacteroidales bacterium]
MEKKNFILMAAAITGTGIINQGCRDAESKKNTHLPNVVWIVCEDMNPILGCYGDKLAKTPNIDRLARNGIIYRQDS